MPRTDREESGPPHPAAGSHVLQLEFGDALRDLRHRRHLTLEQLGHEVGCSKGQLSKLETGRVLPQLDTARRCDEVLCGDGALHRLAGEAREAHELRAAGFIPSIPAQLPAAPRQMVGRDRALAVLSRVHHADRAPGALPVAVLEGTAGVGKTATALSWAESIVPDFPDGQLYVNLRGFDSSAAVAPTDVLEDWLRLMGVPAGSMPAECDALTALFRSVIGNRRMLVVLDNAADSAQVLPLLPPAQGCLAIVTSRATLSSLGVRAGATRHTLAPLTPEASRDLLATIVGRDRVDAETSAVDTIAHQCAHLPLALRVASEYIVSREQVSLHDQSELLAGEGRQLALLARYDDATIPTRAVFSWSYRRLPPSTARVFRLLGLAPCRDFSIATIAALTGLDTDQAQTEVMTLVAAHLAAPGGHERYWLHDLLHAFAAEVCAHTESPDEREAAFAGLLSWYSGSARNANLMLHPHHSITPAPPSSGPPPHEFSTYSQALDWCETEIDNVTAMTLAALERGHYARTWTTATAMLPYLLLRRASHAWITLHELGLRAARRCGDRRGQAWCQTHLALHAVEQRLYDSAWDHLDKAIELHSETADLGGLGWAHIVRARAYLTFDDTIPACDELTSALTAMTEGNDHYGLATAYAVRADLYRSRGDDELARIDLDRALLLFDSLKSQPGRATVCIRVAQLHLDADPYFSLRWADAAIRIRRDIGDTSGHAEALHLQGNAYRAANKLDLARESWSHAATLYAEMNDPRAADVRKEMSAVNNQNVTESG